MEKKTIKPELKCEGCRQKIPDRRYLSCRHCKSSYDLECANVSEVRFYNTMDRERKKQWECPACLSKQPKRNNANTPVRSSTFEYKILNPDNEDTNVTIRKPNRTKLLQERTLNSIDSSMDESLLGDTITSHLQSPGQAASCNTSFSLEQISKLLDKKLDCYERNVISSLKAEIKCLIQEEIKNSVTKYYSELSNRVESITTEQHKMIADMFNLTEKIKSLEQECNILKNDIRLINEQRNPANNKINRSDYSRKFVLYGLDEPRWETEDHLHDRIINTFLNILNINMTGYVESIKRLGKHGHRRPILIELMSKRMTGQVLQNRRLFMRTGIAVGDYLENEALQKHNNLKKLLYEARKEGHHAVIRNNKLIINGQEHYQRQYACEIIPLQVPQQHSSKSVVNYEEIEKNTDSTIKNSTLKKNHSFRI